VPEIRSGKQQLDQNESNCQSGYSHWGVFVYLPLGGS
jgi:hypothetical protein